MKTPGVWNLWKGADPNTAEKKGQSVGTLEDGPDMALDDIYPWSYQDRATLWPWRAGNVIHVHDELRPQETWSLRFCEIDPGRVFDVLRVMDGAHRDLGDWYEDHEKVLRMMIEIGAVNWDTGWYASKHEIASARIRRDDQGGFFIETNVSDDFDTPGRGDRYLPCPEGKDTDAILEDIRSMLYESWDDAYEDQRGNREYAAFSVGPAAGGWHETLVLPIGEYAYMMDAPPGDIYHRWMWQNEAGDQENHEDRFAIPQDVRESMEDWAWKYHYKQLPEGEDSQVFHSKERALYTFNTYRRGQVKSHVRLTNAWKITAWED